jgi:hypothetical protein
MLRKSGSTIFNHEFQRTEKGNGLYGIVGFYFSTYVLGAYKESNT